LSPYRILPSALTFLKIEYLKNNMVETGNFLVFFFTLVIFFTLFSIEPFHGEHSILPSPLELEEATIIIGISIIIILYILLRRKILFEYPF